MMSHVWVIYASSHAISYNDKCAVSSPHQAHLRPSHEFMKIEYVHCDLRKEA